MRARSRYEHGGDWTEWLLGLRRGTQGTHPGGKTHSDLADQE